MPKLADYILAVDGGGTKTEAALFDAGGACLAQARAGPCNLTRDGDAGLAAIAEAWAACCQTAGLDQAAASRACLSAGLAGVSAPDAAARFQAAFNGFGRLCLSSDVYTALLGGTEGGPGILVVVGTGSAACRLDASGAIRRQGGWGFPAGDRGGGAWLGLQLAGAWLDHLDGMEVSASRALLATLDTELGRDRTRLLAWLGRARPADYAALAPAAVAADAEGCPLACALLDQAVAHVLRLARTLTPSVAMPVMLAGGMAPALRPRLGAALGEALSPATPSALHGAWLVGTGRAAPEITLEPPPPA